MSDLFGKTIYWKSSDNKYRYALKKVITVIRKDGWKIKHNYRGVYVWDNMIEIIKGEKIK